MCCGVHYQVEFSQENRWQKPFERILSRARKKGGEFAGDVSTVVGVRVSPSVAFIDRSTGTAISVFTIPENGYPLVYLRYILGSIFILLLPGFNLIKALFPTREIDNVERTALSLGMSLALVPLVGLLLNYTPWGSIERYR